MFEDEASIARTDIDEDTVVGMDKVGELADVYFCLARTDEDSHVMASKRWIGADCASRRGTGHQMDTGVPEVDHQAGTARNDSDPRPTTRLISSSIVRL